jgi:hypothetical protein
MRDARADFEKRRRMRRVLGSRLLSLVLIGLAFLVGRAAWGMFRAYGEVNASLAAVSDDAAALKTASGAEKRLRASLNVAAPGEEVVVIVPRVATASGEAAPKETSAWNLWGLLD